MYNGTRLKDIRGAVVVCDFPFSDQRRSKERPVFVLVELDGEDFIACRISTAPMSRRDKYCIEISKEDFEWGELTDPNSKIYPYSVSTILKSDIRNVCGVLKKEKQDEITIRILKLIGGKSFVSKINEENSEEVT